jgi:hypothetical protein
MKLIYKPPLGNPLPTTTSMWTTQTARLTKTILQFAENRFHTPQISPYHPPNFGGKNLPIYDFTHSPYI